MGSRQIEIQRVIGVYGTSTGGQHGEHRAGEASRRRRWQRRPSQAGPPGLHRDDQLASARCGCPWKKGLVISKDGMQGTQGTKGEGGGTTLALPAGSNDKVRRTQLE